jgi:hypothetical protein
MFGVDAAERQREHQMCLRGSRALHVGLRPLLGDRGGYSRNRPIADIRTARPLSDKGVSS